MSTLCVPANLTDRLHYIILNPASPEVILKYGNIHRPVKPNSSGGFLDLISCCKSVELNTNSLAREGMYTAKQVPMAGDILKITLLARHRHRYGKMSMSFGPDSCKCELTDITSNREQSLRLQTGLTLSPVIAPGWSQRSKATPLRKFD